MRVPFCLMVIYGVMSGTGASAQDICGNIRLSVAEQIDCRTRITNALGDADRQRTQQEYEDRIRRANDALITPPLLSKTPPPISAGGVPNTPRPVLPPAPVPPAAPEPPGASSTLPRGAAPGSARSDARPLVPDLTAPDAPASPLPPISPLPANPPGVLPPS